MRETSRADPIDPSPRRTAGHELGTQGFDGLCFLSAGFLEIRQIGVNRAAPTTHGGAATRTIRFVEALRRSYLARIRTGMSASVQLQEWSWTGSLSCPMCVVGIHNS